MILNGKWPTDGDSVVVRINKEGPWGDVNNLMWAPMGHQTVVGKIHKRDKHLQSVFGNSIPSLGDNFRLSTMCKRGHKWNDYPVTLYAKKGNEWRCEQCIRINKPLKRDPDAPRLTVQERRRAYKAAYRQALASRGLTAKGTERINAYPGSEQSALNKALRTGGNLPTVARLVIQQQRQYWDENPRAKARHDRKWKQLSWWLRYAITPDLRLYHREKSKRRKAQDRGQTPMQVPVSALHQRFNEFNNCCAYCGTDGDMQIEHVVPISKNGAHDIGNIVPACMSCNFSKRSKDMEGWYKNQPFFQ
jgi:5-methylcytosine-specific restriction endonuclease McrA